MEINKVHYYNSCPAVNVKTVISLGDNYVGVLKLNGYKEVISFDLHQKTSSLKIKEIKNIIGGISFLDSSIYQVIHNNSTTSIVPTELSSSVDAKLLVTKKEKKTTVITHEWGELTSLSLVSKKMINLFPDIENIEHIDISTSLKMGIQEYLKIKNASNICSIHFSGSSMHITIFKDGDFEYSNAFDCDSTNEITYAINMVKEHVGISQESTCLVSGYISDEAFQYETTFDKFNNIQKADILSFTRSKDMGSFIPAHYCFEMFSLAACE